MIRLSNPMRDNMKGGPKTPLTTPTAIVCCSPEWCWGWKKTTTSWAGKYKVMMKKKDRNTNKKKWYMPASARWKQLHRSLRQPTAYQVQQAVNIHKNSPLNRTARFHGSFRQQQSSITISSEKWFRRKLNLACLEGAKIFTLSLHIYIYTYIFIYMIRTEIENNVRLSAATFDDGGSAPKVKFRQLILFNLKQE